MGAPKAPQGGNFEAPQEEIWGAAGAPGGNLRRRRRLRRKSSSKDTEKHVFVAKNNVFRRKIWEVFSGRKKSDFGRKFSLPASPLRQGGNFSSSTKKNYRMGGGSNFRPESGPARKWGATPLHFWSLIWEGLGEEDFCLGSLFL